MRVDKVTLVGAGATWQWQFEGPVSVLNGPVGVGKTSLLELIKYGLGGDGLLSRTVREVGKRVALEIDLPTGRYVLVRAIGSGSRKVAVMTADGTPVRTLPIQPGRDEASVSTWLLDQLGIPSTLRLPRSRKRPKDEYTRVSFNDIYGYMYLEQSEADRSTVHDLDPMRDPKRRQTFEVIYRLLGQDIADLRVRVTELEKSIRERRASEFEITSFLERLNVAPMGSLAQERATLTGRLVATQRALATTNAEARAKTSRLDEPRDDIRDLRTQIAEVRTQRSALEQEVDALERLRARITLDHQRTARALVAGGVLASSAWQICPRCLQDLPEPETPVHCVVCRQLEPEGLQPDDLQAEQERLQLQIGETTTLLEQTQGIADDVDAQEKALAADLAKREEALNREARADVAPFLDRVAKLSEEAGALQARLHEMDRWQSMRAELEATTEARRTQEQALLEVQAELAAAEDEADMARGRVDDLSDLFADILEGFKMPWFKDAYIDRDSFRPVVNGMHLPEQLSGGMKVLINVAYFLAGLTYALQSPTDSLLPTFMVIDSPRKNFGSSAEDREASRRIYGWIHTLRTQYGSRFQLIVADNDVPTAVRTGLRIRNFSYSEPLIPEMSHPGEGNVETLDQIQAEARSS